MTEPYVDPGHRLSDEDWAAVVRRARQIREEEQAGAQGGAASGIAPILDMTALGLASRKFFPVSGIPTQLLVLHSGESPLKGGYAKALTEWAGSVYPAPPMASWTWFVDPLHIVYFIPAHLGAWHASEANNLSEAFEQSGYARYTRAEWLTPDGITQLESLAWLMAQRALANKIPARWLTNAEVTRATGGDRTVKGLCLHRQIDPETRTDPGNGYPLDLLLGRIKFYMAGGSTPQSTPTKEWYEMPIPKADLDSISKAVWQMPGIEGVAGQQQTMWRTIVDLAAQSRQQTATITALTQLASAGSGLTEEQITEAVKAAFVDLVKDQ